MSIKHLKIQCSSCEWKHDGGEYWQCNCGKVWDTFIPLAFVWNVIRNGRKHNALDLVVLAYGVSMMIGI